MIGKNLEVFMDKLRYPDLHLERLRMRTKPQSGQPISQPRIK
jgi:hypothetical protein